MNGCVGRGTSALSYPGDYTDVKTALSVPTLWVRIPLMEVHNLQEAMSQPVAFTAVLAHGATLGPHQAVEFDKVVTNVGNAYVSKDGQFTAPVYGLYMISATIKVITKLPNSEQSYKGKVKTHNYINRQNQSTTGKL